MLGLGTLLMIFGFALLAPTLVRPLSGPDRQAAGALPGPHGHARPRERRRQPQRTAVTASALMIGVALVVLVAIFAAGLRATIDQGIDEQVKAVASSPTTTASRRCRSAGRTVSKVDGVTAVSRLRFATGRVVGERATRP